MRIPLIAAVSALLVLSPGVSSADQADQRAARVLEHNDQDGDGRVSRDEWQRNPRRFRQMDADGDGYLTRDEIAASFRERMGGGDGGGPSAPAGRESGGSASDGPASGGSVSEGLVSRDTIDPETLCAIGRSRRCNIKLAVKHGMFETGLRPKFPDGLECRGIDEAWAIDYSSKRDRENYHGGIDMPAPFGTPMIAAAAGTVVSVSGNAESYRGMELILRHSPEDTGIPLWIYTQYAHFDAMPKFKVGDRVKMGQVLGPTGNSGRMGRRVRRPAIHFAVWFSASPNYAVARNKVIPVKGEWMDPNALYRKTPPFDSHAMKALPDEQKDVAIPVMLDDGTTVPADTKLVWPYTCSRG